LVKTILETKYQNFKYNPCPRIDEGKWNTSAVGDLRVKKQHKVAKMAKLHQKCQI
jgi:hypothetical protein